MQVISAIHSNLFPPQRSNLPPQARRTWAVICDTPSASPLAAAAAMRGVVVYSKKFQMKLEKLNTIWRG